jgi:YHS domain-containing protein
MKRTTKIVMIALILIIPMLAVYAATARNHAAKQCPMPAGKQMAGTASTSKGVCPYMEGKKTDGAACADMSKCGDKSACPMGGTAAAKSNKVTSAVCPVMGNKIPDISKAAGQSTYKGKTYYFCCKDCKPKFDADPEKYVGKK